MKNKPIIIVAGEPKSIFFEIFFKSLKSEKYKSPLIIIASIKILESQMKKFNVKKKIKIINFKNFDNFKLDNRSINLLNVNLEGQDESKYIKDSFNLAFKILKKRFTDKFINGPINKSKFLNKKFLGITEYISKKFKTKNSAMLIYNKNLSVCPITTHLPLKLVPNKIDKKLIINKTVLINNFFIEHIGFKPKIAIVGLNPHCESILRFNEDTRIVTPAIKYLKKNRYKVSGPFSADTMFLKQNRSKYNVIIGMYHDQVLTPMKTIAEYDAVNITLGLPFLRISPDHGPNESMFNKNLSNPLSLIQAIKFLDKR